MRQGCPRSPCLFTLLIIDLDEILEEEGRGGIKVEEKDILAGIRRRCGGCSRG